MNKKQELKVIIQYEPDHDFKFEEFIESVLDWPEPKKQEAKETCQQKKK